jgi:hypothetical protein
MEADISIWQKTGHFYFALTGLLMTCGVVPRVGGLRLNFSCDHLFNSRRHLFS